MPGAGGSEPEAATTRCGCGTWSRASRCIGPLADHDRPVMTVAVTADGTRAVSGGDDYTVRVWDLVTGHQVDKRTGHGSWMSDREQEPIGWFRMRANDEVRSVAVAERRVGRSLSPAATAAARFACGTSS
jgi:WD40 repeat protein